MIAGIAIGMGICFWTTIAFLIGCAVGSRV